MREKGWSAQHEWMDPTPQRERRRTVWHWVSKAAPLEHVTPTEQRKADTSHPDKAGSVPVGQTGHSSAAHPMLPWAGCQPGSCTPQVPTLSPCAITPANLACSPAPLCHSCPGGISPLTSQEQTPVFRNPKSCLSGRVLSPPHPMKHRALWALEGCEEVSGEEQCSRRGATAAAARCSKVSLKQEQSAQISPTPLKVSGSRYFGKASKKWGEQSVNFSQTTLPIFWKSASWGPCGWKHLFSYHSFPPTSLLLVPSPQNYPCACLHHSCEEQPSACSTQRGALSLLLCSAISFPNGSLAGRPKGSAHDHFSPP